MIKWIQNTLIKFHESLGLLIKRWEANVDSIETDPPYYSLSPISNANVQEYIKALKWALDNAKTEDIYNIALTGPYGSGKSSILKTFIHQNVDKKYVFLEISLATFKEEDSFEQLSPDSGEKDPENKNVESSNGKSQVINSKSNNEILRLIELSILQQIFYHEEDEKIPDSRFKKIKSFKRKNMVYVTIGIMTALFFGFNFFLPGKLQTLLNLKLTDDLNNYLRWISFLVFIASSAIIIFKSIRLIYGVRLSKFKFNDAEIEIDKNISKSILNNHLDEILYFFEVTDYSVVLIEDLDRFRQAEIFTKLRELNLLINKSKKIKQDVVFIYAVRDEMFQNKERAKFFDFIIPVIPIINSSNSNEALAKIVSENSYLISIDFIDDISLFIDDMRLMYNITNEYHLYHSLLDKELDQNKLLAMIVYKNIYPEDFVLLAEEDGELYKLLSSRKIYIQQEIALIDTKIDNCKKEIKNLENLIIKNEKELRMLYILQYVKKIANFKNFVVDNSVISLEEISQEQDYFDYLINDDVSYERYYLYSSYDNYKINKEISTIEFADVENELDENFGFYDRINQINNHFENYTENLKKQIQELEQEKIATRHLKIKSLLSNKLLSISNDSKTKESQLFNLLLRSGYIDEDYLDYISLFYEGSITKEDRSFLLNVKSQVALEYDYAITKPENLISKIRIVDFSENYILNYNLLDFLLENTHYKEQLSRILNRLNDTNEIGPSFIDGFLVDGTNIKIFVRELVNKWTDLWKYIDTVSQYTVEKKNEYLKYILSYANLSDIQIIAGKSDLYKTISTTKNFLTLLNDDDRTKTIVESLNIKFSDLDLEIASNALALFIYEGDYYEINREMIVRILKSNRKYNHAEFETANYIFLKNSLCTNLLDYINLNIDKYVKNIYLAIPENILEPEITLIELLNNEQITLENRGEIVERVLTKITELNLVKNIEIADSLIEKNKMAAKWANIIIYYKKKEIFSEKIISFLNDLDNATILADEKIENTYTQLIRIDIDNFIVELLNNEKISDETYSMFLYCIDRQFDLEKIADLSYEKMKSLSQSSIIENTPVNYQKLKDNYDDLHLLLLEKTPNDFLDSILDYDIDDKDLSYILESNKFTTESKNLIINTLDSTIIIKNQSVLKSIVNLIFIKPNFAVSKEIIKASLKSQLPPDDKIKLFNMNYKMFEKKDIPEIFKTFPYPYSDIGVLHKGPVIPFSKENNFLANNLKSENWIANVKDEKHGKRIINFKK